MKGDKKNFKKISDFLITVLLRFLAVISLILNRKSRLKFGNIIGDFLRIASKKRYNITLNNISTALNIGYVESKQIADAAYRNLGITLTELLVLDKLSQEEIREYVKYTNFELIEEAYKEGNGIILLSGHFGNWELLAYTAGQFANLPITVIIKPQSNKFADKYLNRTRVSGGNKIVSMYKAARTIVTELKSGNIIAMLADQNAGRNNDVFAEYFGRYAATYSAPAALSLKFNSPIIIGFAVRDNDGIYNVELKRINPNEFTNDEEGIKAMTQKHVSILEGEVRKHPHLWAWQHRRWKHSPESNI